MDVAFRPVTLSDVWPLEKVKPRPDQSAFVSSNEITIAQARFEPGAFDFCIWHGDIRVGLIAVIDMSIYPMRSEIDHPEAVYIWRLLIGAEHQGEGYGSAALVFAEDWGRRRDLTRAQIQASETNTAAIKMYMARGYALTGRMDEDEVQLEKLL